MDDDLAPDALKLWYRRYNEVCNEHRFDELEAFVADDVVVNGERQGLDGYVAGRTDGPSAVFRPQVVR